MIVDEQSVINVAHPDSVKSVFLDVSDHYVIVSVATIVLDATNLTDALSANLENSGIPVRKPAEVCTECIGYDSCTKCTDGLFGTDCSQTCRDECLTCMNYDNCTFCINGRFGVKCEYSCRAECISCLDYDNCTACIDGKYDDKCASDCEGGCKTYVIKYGSYSCEECHLGLYRYNCEYSCDDIYVIKVMGIVKMCALMGIFLGSIRRTCHKCLYTCAKCIDLYNCSECALGRNDTHCSQQCLGYVNGLCNKTGGQCDLCYLN